MDHRGLQRALFRMQHDPSFAARVQAGDAEALASTKLDAAPLAWLRAADPLALAADREGRRAEQLLRNLASELRLSVAVGPAGDGDRAWLAEFPATPEFHRAVSAGARLPLAFAAWAAGRRSRAACAAFRAFVALEAALVRARRPLERPLRASKTLREPPSGAVVRSPAAWVLALPSGTHAAAAALTQALDAGAAAPFALPPIGDGFESVLVAGDLHADVRFGRLRPLRVERLEGLVGLFLDHALHPVDRAKRERFARRYRIEIDAVDAIVEEFVAEGVLLRVP